MLPQGIFGIWLIYISFRMKGGLSKGLRWFGIVVGLGLTLVGLFIVGYVFFVSTIPLWIPVEPEEVQAKIPISPVNIFLHNYFLNIGTLLGVLTFPFWSIFVGISLIRKKAGNVFV